MIDVTTNAVKRIRTMLTENERSAMRLGIVGGGCSGLSYKFKYEDKPRETDHVIEADGVTLVVARSVGNKPDQRLRPIQELQQPSSQPNIGHFCTTAEIVDVTHHALTQNCCNATAVIIDVNPVPHVLTVPVNR